MTNTILTFSGLVSAGLMAGLFFGWAVSVIPGTLRTDDHTYVTTMTSINVAIVNPAFIVPFLVTPLLLGVAAVTTWRAGDQRRGLLLAGAAATYVVGVLAVTFGGNVPLNNALDAFPAATATPDEMAAQRAAYEGPWNRWHNLRTAASITSFGLAAAAVLVEADGGR